MIVARKEWQFLASLSGYLESIRKHSGCILMKAAEESMYLAQPRDADPKRAFFDGRLRIRRMTMVIGVREDSEGGLFIGFQVDSEILGVCRS
jgi:hypothetical protein